MGGTRIASTEESSNEPIQLQGDVGFLTGNGYSVTNSFHVIKQKARSLYNSFKAFVVSSKNETTVVPGPLYSQDLTVVDFFDEIKKNSMKHLFIIPKEAYQKAFQTWRKRWNRCVSSEGKYFEDDKLE
ncbi:hypothetical protein Trydic_g23393 [Trypoxylus dichotomus]